MDDDADIPLHEVPGPYSVEAVVIIQCRATPVQYIYRKSRQRKTIGQMMTYSGMTIPCSVLLSCHTSPSLSQCNE